MNPSAASMASSWVRRIKVGGLEDFDLEKVGDKSEKVLKLQNRKYGFCHIKNSLNRLCTENGYL